MSTISTETPQELQSLRAKIQTLTDLNNRLQALRQIPALLLRPPATGAHALPQSALLRHEFQELKEISEAVRSDKVQEALQAARSSEQKDKSELGSGARRESLKRRRPPSPESPRPYRAFESRDASLFPPTEDGLVPVRLDGLGAYITEYNKSHPMKLRIWSPARHQKLACPVVARFTIPDVVTVYLTLDHSSDDPALVVESATAFGPREKKPPHSQSDFTVYQQLSQQLARMMQSQAQVPLQAFLSLLSSYQNLFAEQCAICHRVLSTEGHVPPVARIWGKREETQAAGWEARHVMCMQ